MAGDGEAGAAAAPEPGGDDDILTGPEALTEVGRESGRWNWALVGPDEAKLPLAGGGAGSVDEMRHCLQAHAREAEFATFFGLLRLTFSSGRRSRSKFVFVQASPIDEEDDEAVAAAELVASAGPAKTAGCIEGATEQAADALAQATPSRFERLQAAGKRPLMERTLARYAHFTTTIEVSKLSALTVECVVGKVRQLNTVDGDFVTVEAFREADQEFRRRRPPPVEKPEVKLLAPPPRAAEVESPQLTPREQAVEVVKQRKRVRLFRKGEAVMVFSESSGHWHDDGVVVDAMDAAGTRDGVPLPERAMKVKYMNGRRFKWVCPASVETLLRASKRPTPPPPFSGQLLKETHNFISEWHHRHFELCNGFLQWWASAEDMRVGMPAKGVLPLAGMQMKLHAEVMHVKTQYSKGVVYAFSCSNASEAHQWAAVIRDHGLYMDSMCRYLAGSTDSVKPDP